MKYYISIILILLGCLNAERADSTNHQIINKSFITAGNVDAMINENNIEPLILIQLNLFNDSLYQLVNTHFPKMELTTGRGTYHRIITDREYKNIQKLLSNEYHFIIKDPYTPPSKNNLYWTLTKQGNDTYGTWSNDGAIEYTCSCLDGNDCIKLGWDEDWWNPLDYYGEAWWAFNPPNYMTISEIRVTVRGGQCDYLPLWSETYMGMRNDSGGWNNDYLLSIDYTDNIFIVPSTWNANMLMPIIGSQDNYVIDNVKLEFYYTCNLPEPATNLIVTDIGSCNYLLINWQPSISNETSQLIYRDGMLIAEVENNINSFEDIGAQPDIEHGYCIVSSAQCGESNPTCAIGTLNHNPNTIPNVSASDETFINKVEISWDFTDETINEYKIYRDGSWMGFVTNDENTYSDLFAQGGTTYSYCVEAINDCGKSDWSCDEGSSQAGGDLNQDSLINIMDVVILINIVIGDDILTEDNIYLADLNQDQIINIQDIIILINAIISN